ncbi:peritrophin-1 [Xylocopa sonorina]|uniref:peritrophin-1 n=1 Tax=Xylocopa sonorina TaxID=1818115 RepID=UPI00403ADA6F
MKALFFIVFAAFVVYVYSDNILKPQCPDEINDKNMMVRHPCNCSTYFVCTVDPPIPMECPSGLQFNQEKQVCDFKWRVKCHPRPEYDVDENNSKVRHPCNCSTYFDCNFEPPAPMACPGGLQFNEQKQVCNYKWRVKCEPHPELYRSRNKALCFIIFAALVVYVYSDNVLRPRCPDDLNETNMMVRHPCNCSTYFVCTVDPPIPMECPAGLQFNQEKQVCDYKWRVKCHPRPECPLS